MPFITTTDGKIKATKLEFNLASHCNYACDECSHFSPYLSPALADYKTFVRDIEALTRVYRVGRFRFVGGEPFLHKNILDYVEAVRSSGIANSIQVCTNGSLLHKVDDEVFSAIDMLSISWYPDARCDAEKIQRARHKCQENGVKLKVERIDNFRLMQIDKPIEDDNLVNNIYRSCQIAHSWSCQTFLDGHFYLCSRPLFLAQYLALKGISLGRTAEVEGVALHEDRLKERLLAYLSNPAPLESCRHCLGTVGKRQPWKSLDKAARRSPLPLDRDASQHVDYDRMRHLIAFSKLEQVFLGLVPSVRLARLLSMIKNYFMGD